MWSRIPCCCLALALVVALPGARAEARCRGPEQVLRFARSVEEALLCAEWHLLGRGTLRRCGVTPPRCAAASFRDVLDLALGAAPSLRADPSADRHGGRPRLDPASPQVRCQVGVLRGVRRYVRNRVRERLRGVRGAPRERLLARIESACEDAPATPDRGGRIPGVAGACTPLYQLYQDGAAPDAGALGRCVTASLEAAIDRAATQPLRPNLVLILTDDQRADSLDWMPLTLAQLADRGVRFDNGFVTTPVCGPSRASILSGRYAIHHGILTNNDLVGREHDFDEDRTVGRWLQSAGYRTGFFGKYVNGDYDRPPIVPLGWDEWQAFRKPTYYNYTLNVNGEIESFGDRPEDYSTDVLAGRAVEFVRRSRNEPFLLILSVFAPHIPAIAADRHAGMFADIAPARPPNFQPNPFSGKPLWLRFIRSLRMPAEQVDALRIEQLETLPAVDEAVARVLDALDRFGLTDNTAVVFTSDNGYHWGEQWWTSKFTGYEESLRVPYVVRYPAARPLGARSDAIVLNIDIAPTFADLARARPMTSVDGESLRPLLAGEPSRRADFAFESFDVFVVNPMEGVRDGRYKLIVTNPTGPAPFPELYDLAEDPYELANRAGDPALAETLERLRARLPEIRGD